MIEKRLALLDQAENDYFKIPYGAYTLKNGGVESKTLSTKVSLACLSTFTKISHLLVLYLLFLVAK